jgi:hypothetical protein
MRAGASDEEIYTQIQRGIGNKWEEHPDFLSMIYLPSFEDREMYRIGG